MNKNDGGPAFPSERREGPGGIPGGEGMSLRDYFAAKAMNVRLEAARSCDFQGDWAGKIAELSYMLADAMLKARES